MLEGLISTIFDIFNTLLHYGALIIGIALLMYIFNISMSLLEKWYKIPELLRWLFCWPIIIFFFFVSGVFGVTLSNLLVALFFRDVSWVSKAVEILAPALMAGFGVPINFFTIYKLVPKYQIVFMGFALLFGVVFSFVLLFGWFLAFTSNELTVAVFIRDALQMTVWLVSAFMGFKYYRKSIKNQTVANSPFNYYH